ncbi:DUF4102 domain-containing protein, partial [Azospirillum sp. TSO22-1]|uniref:DUF4102 domain-containing protein n=1 Tax=Azospirillum sp. TSO22-1 TaxID=716789 RepID=UPI001B3BD35A
MAVRLTAAQVRNAKEPGRYSDGNGLMLVIGTDGSRKEGRPRPDEPVGAKVKGGRDVTRCSALADQGALAGEVADAGGEVLHVGEVR